MRCPKCHYLSFDPEPRCKNCGYDLEVADSELALRTAEEFDGEAPDLPLRPSPAVAPPVTLELVHSGPGAGIESSAEFASLPDERPAASPPVAASAPAAPRTPSAPPPAAVATAPALILVDEPPPAAPPAPPAREAAPSRSPHTTTDLPLFVKSMPPREDAPAPRPPLAVRRATPEVSRAAPPRRRPGPLDHDLLEDLRRVEKEEAAQARADAQAILQAVAARESEESASSGQRLGAAALDGLVLGGIGAGVIWATLRLCEVGLRDLPALSVLPLSLFLGAIVVIYLLLFTAAEGQTPGKMLTGIRVVNDDDGVAGSRLGLGQAAQRALLAPMSLLAFGLGWVPALFGRGLAIHDRLAHTRVVRA